MHSGVLPAFLIVSFSMQFPGDMRSLCCAITRDDTEKNRNISFLYYSENATVRVPKLRDSFEAYLETNLAFQLHPRRLGWKQKDLALARLKGGRLLLRSGKYLLVSSAKPVSDSQNQRAQMYWGHTDPARLLSALQKKGIDCSLVLPRENDVAFSDADAMIYSIRLNAQDDNAVIKISSTETVICCGDESMTAMILEALSTVCDGI